jgi:hypothetical protein
MTKKIRSRVSRSVSKATHSRGRDSDQTTANRFRERLVRRTPAARLVKSESKLPDAELGQSQQPNLYSALQDLDALQRSEPPSMLCLSAEAYFALDLTTRCRVYWRELDEVVRHVQCGCWEMFRSCCLAASQEVGRPLLGGPHLRQAIEATVYSLFYSYGIVTAYSSLRHEVLKLIPISKIVLSGSSDIERAVRGPVAVDKERFDAGRRAARLLDPVSAPFALSVPQITATFQKQGSVARDFICKLKDGGIYSPDDCLELLDCLGQLENSYFYLSGIVHPSSLSLFLSRPAQASGGEIAPPPPPDFSQITLETARSCVKLQKVIFSKSIQTLVFQDLAELLLDSRRGHEVADTNFEFPDLTRFLTGDQEFHLVSIETGRERVPYDRNKSRRRH